MNKKLIIKILSFKFKNTSYKVVGNINEYLLGRGYKSEIIEFQLLKGHQETFSKILYELFYKNIYSETNTIPLITVAEKFYNKLADDEYTPEICYKIIEDVMSINNIEKYCYSEEEYSEVDGLGHRVLVFNYKIIYEMVEGKK